MSANRRRQEPVTMADIARLAGVHSRTVADALKGTGRVAPATREKVLRIAGELNYVPNAAARALATGRTGRVAVLSGATKHLYYANMVHLLETQITASGYEMMLLHTGREVKDLAQATQSSQVDGVIVVGLTHLAREFLRFSGTSIPPCVFIGNDNLDFVDHITLDLGPAVEEVLRVMLAAGRRRIAYAANDRGKFMHTDVRFRTYRRVMEDAGRTPAVIDVHIGMCSEERIQSIKAYIEENGCPDALFCQNDEAAIHAYRAIVELGHRIPDDVLLAGCDGLPYMQFFDPPLSTIALPMEEICARAAQFLQQRIAAPNIAIQQATFQGRLVVRKSLIIESKALRSASRA